MARPSGTLEFDSGNSLGLTPDNLWAFGQTVLPLDLVGSLDLIVAGGAPTFNSGVSTSFDGVDDTFETDANKVFGGEGTTILFANVAAVTSDKCLFGVDLGDHRFTPNDDGLDGNLQYQPNNDAGTDAVVVDYPKGTDAIFAGGYDGTDNISFAGGTYDIESHTGTPRTDRSLHFASRADFDRWLDVDIFWAGHFDTMLTESELNTIESDPWIFFKSVVTATVDDINTDETILDAEQNVTFTTFGFTGEITTFKLVSGSAETSFTGVTSTSGAGDADAPDVSAYSGDTVGSPFSHDSSGTSLSKTVLATLGDGTDTATLEVTYKPQAGDECVKILSASQAVGSLFEDFSAAPTDLSQVLFAEGSGDGQFISVSATGIPTTNSTIDVPYQFHDEDDDTWKQETFLIVDTTPTAFSFTDVTGQPLSTVVESNTITVLGINASTPISLSTSAGMEYRINGGSYVSSSGNVVLNDTVQMRVTSSGVAATLVSGTLDIGGVTDQWDVTTAAADTEPDPFTFNDVIGQALDVPIESNIITVTGITGSSAISLSTSDGMEYRINGGSYTTASGSVVLNDTVQLRVNTSLNNSTTESGILTIGGITDQWDVTTLNATPDALTSLSISLSLSLN